jgi:MFS family permease
MSPDRLFLLCSTVIAAAVMELIDTTIVNASLAHMSGNLGATLVDTSWVITSYAIANIIIIPITSFVAARLGRRRDFIGSIIVFTIASALCGTAGNSWTLVAFRLLQGLGGGGVLSTLQTVVFETFGPTKRGVAAALGGVPIPVIVMLGFVLFAVFSWKMAHLTGVSGKNDFYFPLILRGAGLALLTVPLIAPTVSGLPLKDIAQGSALNNMMRRLGGSFGITLVNTFLATQFAVHRYALVTHLTPYDLDVMTQLANTMQLVASRLGQALINSVQRAYQLLDGAVHQQAGI